MFKWFLPRDERFKALFSEDANNLRQAAELFGELVRDTDLERRRDKGLELKEKEHRGDDVTRRIFEALNSTFLTPLDREDIRDLASGLDNVLDDLESAGKSLVQFKLADSPEELIQMADIMRAATREIDAACSLLWDPTRAEDVQRRLILISDLENQADAIFNLVITRLFDPSSGLDPIDIMKWKEVYQGVEESVDRCKDVANVVGNVVAKNT